MTDILKRKSVILLICIFLTGFLGPMLIAGHPSDVTGAPFARPVWWNAKLPLSSEYEVRNSAVYINWEKLPPEIFALNGRITADPEKEVRIIWSTPQGEQILDILRGSDVFNLLAMSDVYIMPSISEPFGISPLEAMQSNVPVIISKQSGVAEILTHAVKTDFWDIDAMADAIYGILNYPALSNMFIKNGKEEVISLKWDNSARHVRDIYRSLIR